MIRTSPESRSDIMHMLGKDLRLWIKSHDVPIGAKVTKIEQIRSLAEQVWDAIQHGTLFDLRNKRSHLELAKVKVPQTRRGLGKNGWEGSRVLDCLTEKFTKNIRQVVAQRVSDWLSLRQYGTL